METAGCAQLRELRNGQDASSQGVETRWSHQRRGGRLRDDKIDDVGGTAPTKHYEELDRSNSESCDSRQLVRERVIEDALRQLRERWVATHGRCGGGFDLLRDGMAKLVRKWRALARWTSVSNLDPLVNILSRKQADPAVSDLVQAKPLASFVTSKADRAHVTGSFSWLQAIKAVHSFIRPLS